MASVVLVCSRMAANMDPDLPEEGDSEEGELNLDRLKHLAGLFLRAPLRRPRLAIASLLLTLTLGVLAAVYWPRSYTCEVRILAQRDQVLPALGNPGRAGTRDTDSLTRNAADTILQRANILAMIKQLDLVDRWVATRQPILRLKDRLVSSVFGVRSDEDRRLDLVGLLEKRLAVGSDESSITISVEWPDRQLSFEIVAFLQKNFLEARYDTNVNVISEAIRILEARAKPESAEVDAGLAELTKLEGQQGPEGQDVAPGSPRAGRGGVRWAPLATSPSAVARTGEATEELADVRRQIRLVKDDHDRQLMDAQNALADARATLGPRHPTVMGLGEKVAQLGQAPPELRTPQARERVLVAQLGATSARPRSGWVSSPLSAAAPVAPPPARLDTRDAPDVTLARSKLQAVSGKYSELLSRIEAANLELAVTRAAFKYQYSVVRPAEVPREPSKPNAPLILLASILAAALLTILVPGGLDLWRGRFVEAWQVERWLKMPVLGALAPPS